MKIICGIYLISCISSNKKYVGSSNNIRKRFNKHKFELRHGIHHNSHLQRSWNKYGEDAFELSILEKCSEDKLCKREQNYLDSMENLFNICMDAIWKKHSEETKKKISLATKGKNNPMYGRVVSKETREKLRKINLGNKQTPEAKEKQIKAQIGRKVSEKTREKLRKAHTGKKHTPETVEKMHKEGKERKHRGKVIKNATSSYKGVSWKKGRNKWKAYI